MLAHKWAIESKAKRQFSQPVSVRLRPGVEVEIKDLQRRFPHLTATQIINDLLVDGLKRLNLPA